MSELHLDSQDRDRLQVGPHCSAAQTTNGSTNASPDNWPALAPEALHGIAGEIVRAATENSEADPAAVLATTLTQAGVVIDRGPWIRVADDYHHTRLFCALVGKSARGRKGTSEGPVRRIWEEAEVSLGPLAWKPGPMSSGEGLINIIRDGNDADDEGVADKRLFIVESEFAAPLRAMRREGNTLSSVIRTAWDGRTLEPITKNNPIRATRPHIGIVAHITEAELRSLLGSVEIFNGFANRFLWWCVRRAKILPLARGLSDDQVQRLGKLYGSRLEVARRLGRIEFSRDARRVYEELYHDLTIDHDGLYGAIVTRAEVQVIRVALIYACLDGSHEIAMDHLEAAVAVIEYCDASAKYLFGDTGNDTLETRILEVLKTGPKLRSDLHTALSGHVNARRLESALAALEVRGRVECVDLKTSGRTAQQWALRDMGAKEAKKAK